jgi:tetratricopeptide (TPR) repeat protein
VANNELGLLYRKEGKFNAARTAYENAIQKHPDYLPARKNLGVLCDLYLHDFNCALEQFEGYLELQPDDKTVTIWVADVKRRLAH